MKNSDWDLRQFCGESILNVDGYQLETQFLQKDPRITPLTCVKKQRDATQCIFLIVIIE